jgi:dynein light chain roadblock-type
MIDLGDDYAKYISLLTKKAKSMIRDLDPTNDLSFLRIKTKNEEILVTPDRDYMLIAVQGPKPQKDRREEEN